MKKALLIARIFAWPTVLIGLIIFYDLSKPSDQEIGTVVKKYVKHNLKGYRTDLTVEVGKDVLYEGVSLNFNNLCSINDTVELNISPIFRRCRSISLIRDGKIVAQDSFVAQDSANSIMNFISCFLLIPCLLFLPKVRDVFIYYSPTPGPPQIGQMNMKTMLNLFFVIEATGLFFWFKFFQFVIQHS